MEDGELLSGQPAEVPKPDILTIDDLINDPITFRKRLEVVVDGLPWDRLVETTGGGDQTVDLLKFCLNVNNIVFIGTAIDRVFDGNPLTEETKKILDSIVERQTDSTLTNQVLVREVTKRKRLVAWIDFFDEIEEARLVRESEIDHNQEDDREPLK